MVIDSSVFLAILLDEPERAVFRTAVARAAVRLASTASLFETSMVVLSRLGEAGVDEYDRLLATMDVTSSPFDEVQGKIAFEAFRRFGKGRHRAGLNFGDCFSYALAKATSQPLLFKGDDFGHTDIAVAA